MVKIDRTRRPGEEFVPREYLPEDRDQYRLRNLQTPAGEWRSLTTTEIAALERNGNHADDWERVLVAEEFDPECVRRSTFHGMVRIGRLTPAVLEYHDLTVAAGIYDSLIIDCDIGNDTALYNLSYCAHYIIGDACILRDIGELHVTSHAKFGNGVLKEGEPESDRVWLDLMNESGGRAVLPFDGMRSADAYLWARYRDDAPLLARLKEITQAAVDSRRGFYGTIGKGSVIKSCRIIKDVKIGEECYIKGANKLKNLTINSSPEEPSQIGEGVELVNGIIGYGSRVFYGCKAVRFVMGNNTSLKYGARLIHSYLGDNSTISCCEVLNNLIFPAHEQHHNNSFLIASLVMGQSNMAAGATVGSNHNSRANDNELVAGRGFWPGLCTSLKHPSRFASYTLIAKGDYPAELDIPLPFSLLNNNVAAGRLEIMPAYWWNYNMYALVRNARKYAARDRRVSPGQRIEFDFLAPDTAEEILAGLKLIEVWTTEAFTRAGAEDASTEARAFLRGEIDPPKGFEVTAEGIERSRRQVLVLKPDAAWRAYRDMLTWYAARALLDAPDSVLPSGGERLRKWVNLGGQLIPEIEVDRLRTEIADGSLADWSRIHARYEELWSNYPRLKREHALATAAAIPALPGESLDRRRLLERGIQIQREIRSLVFASRSKDYENPFSRLPYRSEAEMIACRGELGDNAFIKEVEAESTLMIDRFRRALKEL